MIRQYTRADQTSEDKCLLCVGPRTSTSTSDIVRRHGTTHGSSAAPPRQAILRHALKTTRLCAPHTTQNTNPGVLRHWYRRCRQSIYKIADSSVPHLGQRRCYTCAATLAKTSSCVRYHTELAIFPWNQYQKKTSLDVTAVVLISKFTIINHCAIPTGRSFVCHSLVCHQNSAGKEREGVRAQPRYRISQQGKARVIRVLCNSRR